MTEKPDRDPAEEEIIKVGAEVQKRTDASELSPVKSSTDWFEIRLQKSRPAAWPN